MKRASKIIRTVIAAIAGVLLIWVSINYFNVGTIIGWVIFGSIIALSVLWKKFCALVKRLWSKVFGKIAVCFIGAVAAFSVGLSVFFSVNMILCFEKPLEKTEAVIILGCQVRGEEPSAMLKNRLDAALDVLRENPEAVCIASGGKGDNENISEAECMRRYLIANGIEDERIIIEDKSASTEENLAFSREILGNLGISDNIMIVTSEFHQYRASVYAKKNGLQTGAHSAQTPVYNLLNYWVREWGTLVMAFIK